MSTDEKRHEITEAQVRRPANVRPRLWRAQREAAEAQPRDLRGV